MMTGCDCELAAYCNRHKVRKSPHLLYLCQTNESYYDAWEEGRGPGQVRPEKVGKKRTRQTILTGGPGTELKRELFSRGYATASGCGCNSKANKMDRWGPEKCRENIEMIADWLVDAATQHSWISRIAVSTPLVEGVARHEIKKMILRAIEAAENNNRTDGLREQD